ncbi:hypothetical protein C8R43DRAFT_297737 [Mycena crocata]|nr:hypothetical protein C8R43DRAFT_297737 [Mycena crocata]
MEQLYSEHTLKLPDGVEIFYTDSGPPKSSDYTTLLVLHGTGFNGYGFVRLHAYAHKHNMRTILWNRREYYGSTPYNEAELADMRAGRQSFLNHQAVQLTWFLEHFIAHENTPRVSADRTTGGFVVMGWSAGVPPTLALVASPDAIVGSVYETIEPYLRSLVVYDPPFLVLGYPALDAEGVRDPFNDPGCTTLDQVFESFYEWAAGYYAHRGVETGDPAGLSFESRKDKRSSDQWTAEDKAKFYDKHAAIRCMIPLFVFVALLKAASACILIDMVATARWRRLHSDRRHTARFSTRILSRPTSPKSTSCSSQGRSRPTTPCGHTWNLYVGMKRRLAGVNVCGELRSGLCRRQTILSITMLRSYLCEKSGMGAHA